METLKDKIEQLIDNSEYTEAADLAVKVLGIELKFEGVRFDSMPWDVDGQKRYIYDCLLIRGNKKYRFDFGTSVKDSCTEESEWDSLNDTDTVEIFAGVSIKGKNISGSVKFNFKKSDFDDHESSFIEAKAKEMSDDYYNNISNYNEEINIKYKEGRISRINRDQKYVNSTLTPDEAVVFINKAIRKKKEDLQKEINISKTKALPHSNNPSMYDVITALTWYDPYTFEDFCANYGYDEDSRFAERTYKAVKKEWNQLKQMFNEEELEVLSYIQ